MSKWLLAVLSLLSLAVWADDGPSIEVEGLFTDTAALKINGEHRVLKVGKASPEGVLLISANWREAVIEINGEQKTIKPSTVISGSYSPPAAKKTISILGDAQNHYWTTATINGSSVNVLLDTGASLVSMNANQAKALGIDYTKGAKSSASTANGVVAMYVVTLDSVRVGELTVRNVQAGITEGDTSDVTLLGMTFLGAVSMEQKGGMMTLTSKY